MSLTCEVIVDSGISFDEPARLADLLEFAADSEPAIITPTRMTLRLCDDATIAELHRAFFDDPSPTDVITFPAGESDDDEPYLGDVVVSVETAAQQASDGDHSVEREISFLSLHGLLHLCGYDDASDDDRGAMHDRQYAHLSAWEQKRGRTW